MRGSACQQGQRECRGGWHAFSPITALAAVSCELPAGPSSAHSSRDWPSRPSSTSPAERAEAGHQGLAGPHRS